MGKIKRGPMKTMNANTHLEPGVTAVAALHLHRISEQCKICIPYIHGMLHCSTDSSAIPFRDNVSLKIFAVNKNSRQIAIAQKLKL